jgi:hypothetical protein
MSSIDAIVQRLNGRKEGTEYRCECPVHANQRHFIVGEKDGKLLFNCKQSAPQAEIIGALSEMGLWSANGSGTTVPAVKTKGKAKLEFVEEYHYRGTDGKTVAIKGRFLKDGEKTFMWRMPEADRWTGLKGLKEADLPLYGTHKVAEAGDEVPIFVVEGEKAVHACWARDIVAVCAPGGASGKDFGDQFKIMANRRVVLWADNDAPGRALMFKLRNLLVDAAAIKEFMPEVPARGDAHDYFVVQGKTRADAYRAIAKIRNEPWVEDRPNGFLVSIPDSGGFIRFAFDSLTPGRNALTADVTMWNEIQGVSRERFDERLNLLSGSGRNTFRGQLNDMFERPKGFWTANLSRACHMAREAYQQALDRELTVENMEPSGDLAVVRICASYLIQGGGSILFSPPGRGKSYTVMAMAVSVDSGCNKIWPVVQRKVMYVNLERSRDSMRFRLASVNKALGLPAERPLPFLNARGRSLAEVYDYVRRGVERYQIEAVVLDSISRAGMGDLTENESANRTVDLLNRLCPTWIALGHTPRADEKHVYGSVHFDAGMDIGIQLLSQTQDLLTGIGLQVTKANDIRLPPLQVIALEWGEEGLREIRPARKREFIEIEAGKRTGLEQEIEEYLLLGGDAGAGEIAAALKRNRSNVAALLAKSARFVQTRKEGRQSFYGVRGDVEN